MKTLSFVIKPERRSRRRAIELYHQDSPFRGRSEESRLKYQRRKKHKKKDSDF